MEGHGEAAADIITGLIRSFKEGLWASAVMRKGLAIKAGEAFVVGVLLYFEAKAGAPFGTALAGWFTVHEVGSSVENLRAAGAVLIGKYLASALIEEKVWLRPCFVNYRTTDEIRRFAVQLLEGRRIDDLDGGQDDQQARTARETLRGLALRLPVDFQGLAEQWLEVMRSAGCFGFTHGVGRRSETFPQSGNAIEIGEGGNKRGISLSHPLARFFV